MREFPCIVLVFHYLCLSLSIFCLYSISLPLLYSAYIPLQYTLKVHVSNFIYFLFLLCSFVVQVNIHGFVARVNDLGSATTVRCATPARRVSKGNSKFDASFRTGASPTPTRTPSESATKKARVDDSKFSDDGIQEDDGCFSGIILCTTHNTYCVLTCCFIITSQKFLHQMTIIRNHVVVEIPKIPRRSTKSTH